MTAVLVINGTEYNHWTSVEIVTGIEILASGFRLTVSENFPSLGEPLLINNGDECEIWMNGILIITGYIYGNFFSYDGTTHSKTIVGRSKTSDLVDSDAMHNGQFLNQKIEEIATTLCDTYNISVSTLIDTGNRIDNFQFNQGDKVFDVLDKLAQLRGVIFTDNELGELVIDMVGLNRTETALIKGQNIISGSGGFDTSQRYKTIFAKGQNMGNDLLYGTAATSIEASATDSNITRERNLIVNVDSNADISTCEKVAQWEVAARRGEGTSISYVVNGWFSGSDLWRPGYRVSVKDDFANIDTDELIISEVTFKMDDGGTVSELTLKPLSAFETKPDLTEQIGLESLFRN